MTNRAARGAWLSACAVLTAGLLTAGCSSGGSQGDAQAWCNLMLTAPDPKPALVMIRFETTAETREIQAARNQAAADTRLKSVDFLSTEESRAEFAELFPDQPEIVDLGEAVIGPQLRLHPADPSDLDAIASDYEDLRGASVRSIREREQSTPAESLILAGRFGVPRQVGLDEPDYIVAGTPETARKAIDTLVMDEADPAELALAASRLEVVLADLCGATGVSPFAPQND